MVPRALVEALLGPDGLQGEALLARERAHFALASRGLEVERERQEAERRAQGRRPTGTAPNGPPARNARKEGV